MTAASGACHRHRGSLVSRGSGWLNKRGVPLPASLLLDHPLSKGHRLGGQSGNALNNLALDETMRTHYIFPK